MTKHGCICKTESFVFATEILCERDRHGESFIFFTFRSTVPSQHWARPLEQHAAGASASYNVIPTSCSVEAQGLVPLPSLAFLSFQWHACLGAAVSRPCPVPKYHRSSKVVTETFGRVHDRTQMSGVRESLPSAQPLSRLKRLPGIAGGGDMTLLDLPAHALEGVARALPGNARKSLRAACRELRAATNATTDFIRIDLGDKLHAEGYAFLENPQHTA